MTSLFSPFDLGSFMFCFSFAITSFFTCFNFFFKINFLLNILNFSVNSFLNFFLSLKPKMFNKISSGVFIFTFIMMIVLNFMSVFSFNFPLSSQISLVFTFALGFWVSLMMFSFSKNMKGFFSHLIPDGAPLFLTSFLFLIELVSNLIRPLTLMVRLVANILAGHLLMSLLSALVFNFSLGFFFYLILNVIEFLVALIQAYIFSTMIVLYFSEV